MCKLCQEKPVYEFTNQRKLCKNCFIEYFQKKFLYTIRKFNLIKQGEKIGYKKGLNVNDVVLKEMLIFLSKKSNFILLEMPKKNIDKLAISECIDSESNKILDKLINSDISKLKDNLPYIKEKKIIKPLYLFLQQEITLFAELKRLKFNKPKFKKDRISQFIDEFEKPHPEVKRAVINSLLKIYKI